MSTTPLHIWFHAMYLMGSTRCGISAKQIQRETGVTYKTAWVCSGRFANLWAKSCDWAVLVAAESRWTRCITADGARAIWAAIVRRWRRRQQDNRHRHRGTQRRADRGPH